MKHPVAPAVRTTLPFVWPTTYTWNTVGTPTVLYSKMEFVVFANDVGNPVGTGLDQPWGYDTWKALYQQAIVNSITINIQFNGTNNSLDTAGTMHVGCSEVVTSPVAAIANLRDTYERLRNPFYKMKFKTFTAPGTGGNSNNFMMTAKFFPNRDWFVEKGPETKVLVQGGSPTDDVYLHIVSIMPQRLSTLTQYMRVTLWYDVTFFDPNLLSGDM